MDLIKYREGYARLERELIDSRAFRNLTKTAMLILIDFLSFIQWNGKDKNSKFKERKTKPRMVNANDLRYSFDLAEKRGFSRSSFNRGITEIVEHGFLVILKHGSGLSKDCNIYGWSNEWKKWGTEAFSNPERPKARSGYGFQEGNDLGQKFHPKDFS